MMQDLTHFRLLRLTLEAQSAHAIHSGRGDMTHDVLLVRDANGLPTLPGSSLAGVLRHRYREQTSDEACNRLFGTGGDEAFMSRIQVGWGLAHDSNNQPVEGLQELSGTQDPVLKHLLDDKPLVRQRVRLNHRGSAVNTGHFDTTLIPAGIRYTSLIGYWHDGSEQADQDWQALLNLLRQPGLRLGHSTRSGAGLFKPASLHEGHWDLTDPEQTKAYQQRPRQRSQTQGLQKLDLQTQSDPALTMTLNLQADGGWRVGGGERVIGSNSGEYGKDPDLKPMSEYRIRWDNDKAKINQTHALLPATAIKGALRHRLAYHYRCLNGDFAGHNSTPEPENCEAVQRLFGYSENDQSAPGRIYIDDITIENPKATMLVHNRIDRFTGGVMRGALFDEEVLWDTPITLQLTVANKDVDSKIRQALQRTLQDLADGWLPLGASGSRGLGVFLAQDGPNWSDGGHWINGADHEETPA